MGNDHDNLDFENDIADNKNVTEVNDDLDDQEESDIENDHDIEENKNVTEVDTGDLDFKDDIVDDEKSDEEKKSDMENDHNIEENKNELNEQCEHKALASDGNEISVTLL